LAGKQGTEVPRDKKIQINTRKWRQELCIL